ncbi:MAG: methylated-DNA--[protein]-cysteine S-methyltransferase [Pseudomonadota bacterium]
MFAVLVFHAAVESTQWVEGGKRRLERAVIAAPFGRIVLAATDDAIVEVELLGGETPLIDSPVGLLKEGARQFERYFAQADFRFSLPLLAQGTLFQRKVWQSLRGIAPGTVMTYAEICHTIGSGARAVGGACRANPYPIIIPCHRVVACGGMGGYAGKTAGFLMDIKRWLLMHEGVRCDDGEAGCDRTFPGRPMGRARAQR